MQALINALQWALDQIPDDPDPEHQQALASARAALTDALGMLPVYAVAADRATGEWLTTPKFAGRYEYASDWATRRDTRTTHFDTYETPDGATRAIIVHWSN
jgi:hypothetical protein